MAHVGIEKGTLRNMTASLKTFEIWGIMVGWDVVLCESHGDLPDLVKDALGLKGSY